MVILEMEIFIYDVTSLRCLHSHDTCKNPRGELTNYILPISKLATIVGVAALSPIASSPYLAFPASTTYDNPSAFELRDVDPSRASALGKAAIFNAETMEIVCTISAHDCPLSCMSMNQDGSLLATSSERGTVIRVWNIPSGRRLYQFRRGSSEAEITSMSFDLYSHILAVASAHVTIHFFKLDYKGPASADQISSTETLSSSISSS